ncbi:hypothetical protein ACIBEA_14320 [Streptomyces sp. NPDC051555]|uniref:hypothetical protein n=1 Tax=Streptomyces sp. NPDC051555 TaxID=3365657 RepID=UPI0037AA56F8
MDIEALKAQMEFLTREGVAPAVEDYFKSVKGVVSTRGSGPVELPDPVEFLRERGIELPDGQHLSAEYAVDGQVQAIVGPECIGKMCLCWKDCEEKKGVKHCTSICF